MKEIFSSPLTRFSEIRSRILKQVVDKTLLNFKEDQIENELVTALYLEKQRLARSKGNFFTKKRLKQDRRLWSEIQAGLLKPAHVVNRKDLLKKVCEHYAEEVGGHFHSSVYKFATYALPLFFSYLLNAASLKRILPWRMVRDVNEKLQITGEVEHLKKLAQKGTILLVPTHQSNIDSVLIGYLIYRIGLPPFAYGAGLNLFLNPILIFS
jgi:glycerol-3-phosphate O-acyltransferase